MKFAFSTTSCPTWDFETIAARAKEYGYDGVEVRGFLDESLLTASNVFLSDPAKVRGIFAAQQVAICCLSSSIEFTGEKKRDARSGEDLRRFIDAARALDCPLVKVFDMKVKPGWSRASAGIKLGDWLLPFGDYAAERGVTIVVENALSFRSAKELWAILDRLSHPSIACAWDFFNAALIGESPAVSVPTLNQKIQYVQLKDAKIGPLGATLCKLGEGDVPMQALLQRLMGIGYGGFVTFEWEKAWLPNIAEPEEVLPDAIGKLREWTKPPVSEKAKKAAEKSDAAPAGGKEAAKKPAPAKPAAKPDAAKPDAKASAAVASPAAPAAAVPAPAKAE